MVKKLLLLCSILFLNTHFSYSQQLNAEIFYQGTSQTSYELTLTIVDKCNGYTRGSSSTIYCRNGKNYQNISLTKTSSKDISPVCSSVNSACVGGSGASSIGLTKTIYKGSIDLTKTPFSTWISNGACELIFSFHSGGRISTNLKSSAYDVASTLNYCNVISTSSKKNNSPKFVLDPLYYSGCNNIYSGVNLAIDTLEKDSITYSLVSARHNQITPVLYRTPFDSLHPTTCKCIPPGRVDCKPIPNAKPPLGTYLDSKTGSLIFTGTKCDEIAYVAIKVREWRKDGNGKMVEIGSVTRDYPIRIVNIGPNLQPKIGSIISNDYFVWAGDSIVLDTIKITDNPHPSTPNGVKDSVLVKFNPGNAKGIFTLLNPKSKDKNAIYKWTTKKADASLSPYTFAVEADDNACPLSAKTQKSFSIYVLDSSLDIGRSITQNCNTLYLKAFFPENTTASFTWKIRSSSNSFNTIAYGANAQINVPASDKYYVSSTFTIGNLLTLKYYDSIIATGIVPAPNLGTSKIRTMHVSDSIILSPGTFKTYQWQDSTSDSTFFIKGWSFPTGYNKISLTVEHSNGCVFKEEIFVNIQCKSNGQILDTITLTDKDSTYLYASPYATNTWTGNSKASSLLIDGKRLGVGIQNIYLSSEYPNGCKENYKFLIRVECTDTKLCKLDNLLSNQQIYYNDSITLGTQHKYKSYKWSNNARTDSIFVKGKDSGIGSHNIRLDVISDLQCTFYDELILNVLCNPFTFSIGNDLHIDIWDSASFNGPIGFENYSWNTGSQDKSTTIKGTDLGTGKHKIRLIVSDSIGCEYSDEVVLTITDVSSIEDIKLELTIYPSPTKDNLFILTPPGFSNGVLRIFDLNGKVVLKEYIGLAKDELEIRTLHLPNGTYLIDLEDIKNNKVYKNKFIKN